MQLTNTPKTRFQSATRSRAAFMKRFAKDEDGSIIIMSLLLLVSMLIIGGMAVDFMHFEAERAELQSVSDRAVLAAAELGQEIDPADVVIDYFEKAGYGGAIVGAPVVNSSISSRSVRVNSRVDMNTFFLKLINIDQLTAPAAAGAIEGVGEIEISLVLDVSGSMRENVWVNGQQKTRISLLKTAASNFIDEVLTADTRDRVSVNLVMYSAHVNVGNDIFNRMRVNVDTATSYGGTFRNPSRCIDFITTEYNTTALNTTRSYQQVETVDLITDQYTPNPNSARQICPSASQNGIIALSQDADQLKAAINSLQPLTNTSIFMGMKWGTALLDPSTRSLLGTGVSSVDPVFAGVRPYDFASGTSTSEAQALKYVVLMTDGENVPQPRMRRNRYDTYSEMNGYLNYSYLYWLYNRATSTERSGIYTWDDIAPVTYTNDEADNWLDANCTAAKDEGIRVFTIAMGATTRGNTAMDKCATQGDYYATQGAALNEIFEDIAKQITDLRLNL